MSRLPPPNRPPYHKASRIIFTIGSVDQVSADSIGWYVDQYWWSTVGQHIGRVLVEYRPTIDWASTDMSVDTRLRCTSADVVASSSTDGRYFTDTLPIVYWGIGDIFSHVLSGS